MTGPGVQLARRVALVEGVMVGSGFAVGADLVLTCAHVVPGVGVR
jgi:hypothetical protein